MNYSNTPVYTVMPWIPPDIRPLFDAVMIAFVIFFFVSIHYRVHIMRHLIPPPYVFRLREWMRRIWPW